MKTYVKPLQKGGRRRTRKRRGGSPECGRCLPVCRCGNANQSPECRKCVMTGRTMSSSRRTRKQSRKRYGIQDSGQLATDLVNLMSGPRKTVTTLKYQKM